MANHKLILDDDLVDEFSLVAIHCSEEAYKMAFLLNKYTGLQLKRKPLDLDFSNKGLEITFPLYEYEDFFKYKTYNLVANKSKSHEAYVYSSGGLFHEIPSEKTVITYLLPEFKKVDYFLKIHSDFEAVPLKNTLSGINQIKQVISAYQIETNLIKSRTNLIFD